ncbi:hypothetical protein ACTFIU_000145 [Dictyostelium citrinum]
MVNERVSMATEEKIEGEEEHSNNNINVNNFVPKTAATTAKSTAVTSVTTKKKYQQQKQNNITIQPTITSKQHQPSLITNKIQMLMLWIQKQIQKIITQSNSLSPGDYFVSQYLTSAGSELFSNSNSSWYYQ